MNRRIIECIADTYSDQDTPELGFIFGAATDAPPIGSFLFIESHARSL